MNLVRSIAVTHKGLVRQANEDHCAEHAAAGLWVVCDGMGGHADGAFASRLVTDRLLAVPADTETARLPGLVRSTLVAANADLRRHSEENLLDISGTTAVVLLIRDGHFAVLWVGDSRIYRWRRGALEQLTRDHSWVEEQVEAGLMTPAQAAASPRRNTLTRAVGADETLEVDLRHGPVATDDLFLLCSDGLTRVVDDAAIAATLAALAPDDLAGAADALLQQCLDGGAPDNVTLVLVQVDGTETDLMQTVELRLSSRDDDGHLTGGGDGDDSSPGAQAGGAVIEGGEPVEQDGR